MMREKPQKVLLNFIYLSKYHAGGKDQFALNLLQGLADNDMLSDCVVAGYDYIKDTIKNIAPEVELVLIPSGKRKGELFRLLDIERINTWVIPKIIKRYNIGVVFHASCTNGLHSYKVPSVVIPHDIKAVSHRVMGNVRVEWYKYILYKFMYALDFYHADKIIAISEADMIDMQKFYPKYRQKIVQIYNPVKVSVKGTESICRQKKDIVAINLQFHHKNIITLIKAFEAIKDKLQHNLVLVGNLPKRVSYLKDYVERHNLSERVIFTDFIGGESKRELLLNCALYVNPSLFEGFGMTAVEAMILGVPTLLSKVSANYEVTKGLCHYYEPADDVSVLAQAILDYFSNPDDEESLAKKSKEMLVNYDYRRIAVRYMELFEEVKANTKKQGE